MRNITCVSLVFLLATTAGSPQAMPTSQPTKQAAEAQLTAGWSKQYPGEKVLKVEGAGDPVLLEKVDAKGKVVERKMKYPFQVTIQKGANETVFEAGANYVQKGNAWVWSEIGVGNVAQKANDNQKLPPKPQMKEMILAQLAKEKPDYTFSDLKTDDGTLGKSGARFWYTVEGDYKRSAAGKKTQNCGDATFNLSRQDASAPWVVRIDYEGRCQ